MTSAEAKTKAAIQIPAKPQVNGQALTTPLKGVIPPLPKNLPTVPPPNYKAPIPPAPVKTLRESSSLKAEIMRNIGRMHPYKSVEGRGHGVRPNADAELEISSETTAAAADDMEEGQESAKGAVERETVQLVLDKIVEELKNALRQHLTKDLVDTRMSVCLDERGMDS